MSFNLTNHAIATAQVPANLIVNGYEIEKIEAGAWGCLKVGAKSGKCFKSKKAAVAYAQAN